MPPIHEKLATIVTKQGIADLYIWSLGNSKTRLSHVLLKPPLSSSDTAAPSERDIKLDFVSWFAGYVSAIHGIDAEQVVPPQEVMVDYILKNFEKALTAVAA